MSVAGKGGLVLVVDDEDAIRTCAERILEDGGFRVALAVDGDEAWEQFHRHHVDITAVILDLQTPGRPTEDLVRAILDLKPNVRIVLSSGFFDYDLKDRLDRAGVAAFLEKPWSRDDLLEALQSPLIG